ncbi:unnamed protein product [Rotaria sp. Silwood1]|nr:unnamed protein product [Rotaria sp. Silwood1]
MEISKINISGEKAYFSPNTSLKFVDNRINVNESLYYILSAQGSQQQAVTSIRREGIGIVHLHRSENYEGFGFHLHYNKSYFLVRKIEDDSPAADGGLYVDDIILSINQQSTENMPYGTFAKLVDESSRLDLIVQSREEYLYSMIHRPKENRQSIPTIPIPIPISNKKIKKKRRISLSKILKKITNR